MSQKIIYNILKPTNGKLLWVK